LLLEQSLARAEAIIKKFTTETSPLDVNLKKMQALKDKVTSLEAGAANV
jgi:hypothetical protein